MAESHTENSDCQKDVTNTINIHKKKRKPIRQRKDSDESEDEEFRLKLAQMKELQNLRKRPNGISITGLASGKKLSAEEEIASRDPFKIKIGGMINMQALKSGKMKEVDDAYGTGIGTQFSVETNKRDEDDEMMKYIEEQLVKKKGKGNNEEIVLDLKTTKYLTPEEAALQSVPSHLRESSTRKNEEMLSNQMLNGIPEVDLGIDAKIKNIEATEDAKLRLLREQNNKKDGPSPFVPTNMAVNFVQHNRFNIDCPEAPQKRQKVEEKPDNSQEERWKSKKDEKATDDYHYEKFKKMFRRY